MLRKPVSLLAGLGGVVGIVLGTHGLYVYFKFPSLYLQGGIDRLFLHFTVPMRFRDAVEWASIEGAQSWFLPAVILIAGIVLWKWSNLPTLLLGWLRRLRLW